jgi:hypothetical protein
VEAGLVLEPSVPRLEFSQFLAVLLCWIIGRCSMKYV